MATLSGLYAITDPNLTSDEELYDQVQQAILGGVNVLQLRDKVRTDAELYDIAQALQKLCREHNVYFILNDRLKLAQQINADGLHIGQHDLDFEIARTEFADKIIGMSCYGNLDAAILYQNLGADYVAFGACFNSPTKPLAKVISTNLIGTARQQLSIPICAIGGITLNNTPSLISQGVDMVAVISDLWGNTPIYNQAQRYKNLFENAAP